MRIDWWRQRDRHTAGSGQIRAVAQKPSRARKRHRNNRHTGGSRSFEGAQLKGANSILRRKGSLRKYKNGFPATQDLFHLVRLPQARVGVRAVEREMPATP